MSGIDQKPKSVGQLLREAVSPEEAARLCYTVAQALLAQGRDDEGLRYWEHAINLRPEWMDIYPPFLQQLVLRGHWDRLNDLHVRERQVRKKLTPRLNVLSLGVRFVTSKAWCECVGQIAHLDVLVKLRLLGLLPPHQHVLVIEPQHVANNAYLRHWLPYFPLAISDPALITAMYPLFESLEVHGGVIELADGRFLTIGHAARLAADMWRAQGRNPALLDLSPQNEERGRLRLAELGVPASSWFVSMHVRHTCECSTRDGDIGDYRLAIETITRRGGWVIRMGNPAMPPLPAMPQVIDYAHSPLRSDWMDVFLWARSRFFLGTNSGPFQCAATFGVPVICTNMAPHPSRPYLDDNGLYLPKLYWSEQKSLYLSFAESYRDPRCYARGNQFTRGIRVVGNTPEEINEVVMEMLERLEGAAVYTEEDRLLQQRFDALVPPVKHVCGGRTAIGRDFLRRHQDLLEEGSAE